MLALAAYKTNRNELGRWLRRRAELLVDTKEICEGRPGLEEVFRQPG
jgi:hypothetical protein